MSDRSSSAARAREQLLAKLLSGEGLGIGAQPIRRRGADAGVPPLSFAQERLWFLQQLDPGSAAYNLGYTIHLSRRIDRAGLERTFHEVARRHEVLRTTYLEVGGKPVQRIDPDGAWPLGFLDFSDLPPSERDARVDELAEANSRTPFVLSAGPPVRATLIKREAAEYTLLIGMHHIVIDGRSLNVLFEELDALYEAFSRGEPSPLPELEIQYSDYAVWQRGFLRGRELRRQLDYWRGQLAGVPHLDLCPDHARPLRASTEGAGVRGRVGPDVLGGLTEICQKAGATLFMTLLAAFKVLLYRYTGQTDIAVGAPFANRNRPEIENLVGFFVNTLVLRNELDGNTTFREHLARVRATTLRALDHQDLPFERLVEELAPTRASGVNPIVQVLFGLQQSARGFGFGGGATMGGMSFEAGRVDLEVNVAPDGAHLGIAFSYSTDLFEHDTIQRMLGHYETLLGSIVANPDAPIAELALEPAAERQSRAARQEASYPRSSTIAQLFEAQVARRPEAPALSRDGDTVCYRELNERANRLAHWLRERGVGPDVLVGLCVERSVEMVVGVLGILKAGGAYVPLDPEYPAARLEFMMADTRTPVLLTQRRLEQRFADYEGEVLCLDGDGAQLADRGNENPAPSAGPDDLAYVMYTSGSTGRPKGVCVENRSVVRLVMNTNYAELGAEEVFLQFAPISFDAATFELWGSLLHGARLVLCPPGRLSLARLASLIEDNRVSVLWLTGAVFHQMVDEHLDALKGVRQLLAGGEALSVPHVQKVIEQLPHGHRLINGYGPTENTTFSCCHVMTSESVVTGRVPIGAPIANTWVHVLGPRMTPVPTGVPGELFLGGDGLAREYLNQPELTSEKFVADPFSAEPGARLYRTGDQVRARADGVIEFLGRRDDQVKLRGFRIELGEIRSTLLEQPGVRDALVVVREDHPGDRRLTAYVVMDQAATESADVSVPALRQGLAAHLPAYMIPVAYVPLDGFPLSPNGKIDRKALPAPSARTLDGPAYEAPLSETERGLAEIWQDILKPGKVGRNDNFFELGGHSLLATQVTSRVRDVFNQDLPLRFIFEAPTLAGLAERVDALSGEKDPDAPILGRGTRTRRRVARPQ